MTKIPEESAHEVAVLLASNEASTGFASEIKKAFPELSIKEWFEILPELKYMTESMDLYMPFPAIRLLLKPSVPVPTYNIFGFDFFTYYSLKYLKSKIIKNNK